MRLLLVVGLTAGTALSALAGGTAVWDRNMWNPGGGFGGWRYSDGATSYYNRNQYHAGAGFCGYQFYKGGTPHLGPKNGEPQGFWGGGFLGGEPNTPFFPHV